MANYFSKTSLNRFQRNYFSVHYTKLTTYFQRLHRNGSFCWHFVLVDGTVRHHINIGKALDRLHARAKFHIVIIWLSFNAFLKQDFQRLNGGKFACSTLLDNEKVPRLEE